MSTETQILALFEEGNPVPDMNGLDTVDLDAAAYLATLRAGSSDMTQLDDKIDRTKRKRPALVWLAAAFAVAVLVVGSVALLLTRNNAEPEPAAPETEALTPESLAGNEFRVVGGLNQNLPQQLALDEDGAFQVIDGGRTVDSGTYTIEGDQISFVSVWEEGRAPEGYGIQWANDDCPDCDLNFRVKADKCEGIVGDYQLLFEAPTTVTFKVVFDECLQRTGVANGLQLELAGGG